MFSYKLTNVIYADANNKYISRQGPQPLRVVTNHPIDTLAFDKEVNAKIASMGIIVASFDIA